MQAKDTRYSQYAGLVMIGEWMQQRQVWKLVEEKVAIKQKTVVHSPQEKLLDLLIHVMSGAERMVTLNTGIRTDEAVQRSFGRQGCAEQSGVSTTLDRCNEQNIEQMEEVQAELMRRYGRSVQHRHKRKMLVLDVDMSGLLSGKQAEKSEKGFFSGKKGGEVVN